MATYEQRGRTIRVQVRMRGQTPSATFDTREDAEAWAERTEARIRAGEIVRKYDETADPLVAGLFQRYSRDVSKDKGGKKWEQARLLAFGRDFRHFDVRVSAFTPGRLAEFRDKRLETVSSGTVCRELALISAVFTHAKKEWGMPITENPVAAIRVPKPNPSRKQRLHSDDVKALLHALDYVEGTTPTTKRHWVAWALLFGIETAMRKGEILRITFDNIHLDRRFVHLPKTKNGTTRDVPLSRKAIDLLKLATARNHKKGDALVPVTYAYFDQLFIDAKQAVGLEHLHFHDSRHEGTTLIAGKLSNVLELAAVTGHKSLKMLQIYFNPTATEMASKLD
ncbi:tyrosine-type recombinase/integrase [Cupriavidus alkaliphilus]|uniref:tyrosine-type recombinase/integrase n=1 Tax=Cupriavidus alkaliphilus TaxID=942866 RepID=UPI00160E01E8|nr:site-specific integrase [Cupriavidus alkaliphilus]MBB2915904.1 integrase [Cupriavidus alkaliphilus]